MRQVLKTKKKGWFYPIVDNSVEPIMDYPVYAYLCISFPFRTRQEVHPLNVRLNVTLLNSSLRQLRWSIMLDV